ncbi:MAG: HupE/UreJ family protein [Williamsia sp.]|nr:HupE/UreJ family protein [Williamsia sp.]
MPSSVVDLFVLEGMIRGEAKIPLLELSNAVGDQRTANMQDPFFKTYFKDHIRAVSAGLEWSTSIQDINVITDTDPFVGTYQEAVVRFTLVPPDSRYLHTFSFNYDVVMHRVITHSALVYVRQDWNNGIQEEDKAQQIGVIGLDIPTEKIVFLQVDLEPGSWWKGFKGMIAMGMQHIKEGTDHLLFLIVLLLPAMLLAKGRQWGLFGGIRYSITRLLKIVTAFTIGHSVTLLTGASGWLRLPGQPVEIMIAFSILVSAVHAIRPVFPGKEVFIAGGFGLIHGLAFAAVLSNLELSSGKLALSILGFNLGIELMQLFVILLIVPWLLLLSKTPVYRWIRITGALLAAIAALAWIIQRGTGKPNWVTGLVEAAGQYSLWCIAALALVSLAVYALAVLTRSQAKLVS